MEHQPNAWPHEEQEEEEEATMELVPLHLAERNLLTRQFPFQKQGLTSDDSIVVFTSEDKGVKKDVVLFPRGQKVETLQRSRECTEDKRPETLEALQEMKRQAMAKAKREATAAQVQNAPSTSRRGRITEGKFGKHATVIKSNFPGKEGYMDTYDWDHHHDLSPSFTFSRERHSQRMAMLAQMPELQSWSPLEDINLPFQMNNCELFDPVEGSNETSD